MKQKLLIFNALLCGLLILGASEFYRQTLQAEARYRALEQPLEAAPLDPTPPPAGLGRVQAASYLPIVQRLLFFPDRNADVIVEVEEPVPVQRPELPILAGLVDFGDGPNALMHEDPEAEAGWFAVGEKIGEFEFVGVNGERVQLAWNGQQFEVAEGSLTEARERASNRRRNARSSGRRPPSSPAPAPAPAAADLSAGQNLTANSANSDPEIGEEFLPGRFRTKPGDDRPHGFEHENYRKVVRQTPFGTQSWWEKVEK